MRVWKIEYTALVALFAVSISVALWVVFEDSGRKSFHPTFSEGPDVNEINVVADEATQIKNLRRAYSMTRVELDALKMWFRTNNPDLLEDIRQGISVDCRDPEWYTTCVYHISNAKVEYSIKYQTRNKE